MTGTLSRLVGESCLDADHVAISGTFADRPYVLIQPAVSGPVNRVGIYASYIHTGDVEVSTINGGVETVCGTAPISNANPIIYFVDCGNNFAEQVKL